MSMMQRMRGAQLTVHGDSDGLHGKIAGFNKIQT
jgi:hypothetical protein